MTSVKLTFNGSESHLLRDYYHLRPLRPSHVILTFCFTQEKHVNLLHIESRMSKRRNSEFEIFIDCDINREQLNDIFHLLKSHTNVLSVNPPDNFTVKEDGKFEKWKYNSEDYVHNLCVILYLS